MLFHGFISAIWGQNIFDVVCQNLVEFLDKIMTFDTMWEVFMKQNWCCHLEILIGSRLCPTIEVVQANEFQSNKVLKWCLVDGNLVPILLQTRFCKNKIIIVHCSGPPCFVQNYNLEFKKKNYWDILVS